MTLGVLFSMRKLQILRISSGFAAKLNFLETRYCLASLKDCNCLSDDYLLNNLVVLGLKPDTSKIKAILNFDLQHARFYIWLCRSKRNIPTIDNFKPFLKQCKKEIGSFSLW